jgi:hypothetical protein
VKVLHQSGSAGKRNTFVKMLPFLCRWRHFRYVMFVLLGGLLGLFVLLTPVFGDSAVLNKSLTMQLLDLLNLDYPGLEAVKSAVQAGNYNAAVQALVQYYQKRQFPRWYTDTLERSLWVFQDDASADDILNRKFTILLKTAQLSRQIDWKASPFGDREWAWILNRHQFFQTLVKAYQDTRDEKYAADFDEIIRDWIIRCPVPSEPANSSAEWRTIEAGIRMMSSWPIAWHMFQKSPSFATTTRILMLKSFAEHADYLMKFPTFGNWTLMESNGLLHVGVLFPEFKDAPIWRKTAVERLVQGMRSQVYPDGAQFELTTSYHNVCLFNFLQPVILKQFARDVEFPSDYYEGLRRMMLFNMGVVRPDGIWPMLNDSDADTVQNTVIEPALKLGGSKVKELEPILKMKPSKESVCFPYAGIVCMRTGSEPEDLYLMMDAGPYGALHQHEDKLNIEVYAYGRPLVIDPGRYSYHVGEPFRAAGAHNVVLVDGMGQNRASNESVRVIKEPSLGLRWFTSSGFDYAEGVYDEGFGPQSDKSVVHVRKVFFVKPEYWIVIDVLKGNGRHKAEQLWHFTPSKLKVAGKCVQSVVANSANLAVVGSTDADIRVVEGEETPVLGYVSYRYNERQPSPTAVFLRECELPEAFETVLYPSPAGKSVLPRVERIRCLVEEKRPAKGALSAISIRSSEYEDLFVLCHDPEIVGKTKRFLNYKFTGEGIWLRTKGGKVLKSFYLSGENTCELR